MQRTIAEVMSSPPVTIHERTPAGEVAKLMMDRDIGAVIVVDDAGLLKGLITESDFTGVARCVPFTLELAPVIFGHRAATFQEMQRIVEQAKSLPAQQVMSENVRTCSEHDDVSAVVHLMLTGNLKHVPVVRAGKPVGMVARHDVLKLLASASVA